MTFVYNSHLIHNCVYLTVDNIFENGIIVWLINQLARINFYI
jgi:hypothetical protein